MFQLSRETDYASQFLKILSKNKNRLLGLGEVSSETGISFLFLQKIARKLKAAKLVKAQRGAKGGYVLALSPQKINLKKIIEAIEGKCLFISCADLKRKGRCLNEKKCRLRNKFKKINKKLLGVLSSAALDDL